MKLMPASRAAWIVVIDVSWSGSPQPPNIIAPRHSGLTWIPVRPRLRYSMTARLVRLTRQNPGVTVSFAVCNEVKAAHGLPQLARLGPERSGSGAYLT